MRTIILTYLLTLVFPESNQNYEQLATDHFFKVIWKQDFADYKAIEFDQKTDTAKYSIYGCSDWDIEYKKKFDEGKIKEFVKLKLLSTDVSIKRITKSRFLKLFVGTRSQIGDTYVVPIQVYRPYDFVEHYFIKLDKDGNFLDVCHFGEII